MAVSRYDDDAEVPGEGDVQQPVMAAVHALFPSLAHRLGALNDWVEQDRRSP